MSGRLEGRERIAAGYSGEWSDHARMSRKASAPYTLLEKHVDWLSAPFRVAKKRWKKGNIMSVYIHLVDHALEISDLSFSLSSRWIQDHSTQFNSSQRWVCILITLLYPTLRLLHSRLMNENVKQYERSRLAWPPSSRLPVPNGRRRHRRTSHGFESAS